MEFSKLEKVELGGIKGKMLSHQVVEIFSEFNEIFAVFGNRTYDGLDATNRVCSVRQWHMLSKLSVVTGVSRVARGL